MRKEKYCFGLLTKDVPEKEFEANYLVQSKMNTIRTYVAFLGLLTVVLFVLLFVVSIQTNTMCSAEVLVNGGGKFSLNEETLSETPFKEFELKNGTIKVKGTVPCYTLSRLMGGRS